MTSSTSSSKATVVEYLPSPQSRARLWLPPGGDEGSHGIFRDPSALAILLCCIGTLAFAALRFDVGYADSPRWFWIDKLLWKADAAAVVAGDSRIYRGVDPAPLSDVFGSPARNFGFSGTLLTPSYIERAVGLLDPQGPRVLLLGVTGASLRDPARAPDGFRDASVDLERQRIPPRFARRVSHLGVYLRPIALDLLSTDSGWRATSDEYAQVFHDSGWVESDRSVEDPVALGVSVVLRDFELAPVSRSALNEAFESLRAIAARGVRVYVFYPPVPEEVSRAELGRAGVTLDDLRARTFAAGARWIEIPFAGLRSYDGTHLDGPSARVLGRRLAEVVATAQ